MATKIGASPVWREVDTARGPMLVAISAHGVLIKEKGRRGAYGPIPFEALHDLGAKYAAGVVGQTKPKRRRVTRGLLTSE